MKLTDQLKYYTNYNKKDFKIDLPVYQTTGVATYLNFVGNVARDATNLHW